MSGNRNGEIRDERRRGVLLWIAENLWKDGEIVIPGSSSLLSSRGGGANPRSLTQFKVNVASRFSVGLLIWANQSESLHVLKKKSTRFSVSLRNRDSITSHAHLHHKITNIPIFPYLRFFLVHLHQRPQLQPHPTTTLSVLLQSPKIQVIPSNKLT